VNAGRVAVTRMNVCCAEAGSFGCKSIAMEAFWNRGSKKFLQGDSEAVWDVSPASMSGGLRGFAGGCTPRRDGSSALLRCRLKVQRKSGGEGDT